MLTLDHLSLQRGTSLLLADASLTLHAGQRVALVGANGTGKSSLFALIRGALAPDKGDLFLPDNIRIAHMAQEVPSSSRSAQDYVLDGDVELRRAQQALADAEARDDHQQMAQLHQRLDDLSGYTAESRAAQLLHGLGFSQDQLTHPVSSFSGGWRIRLNLAQALMCPSDLMLLDEPTNHLDLDAILWLEGWLRQYPGTLLFISHDRDFIDRVADHVVHLDQQKLTLYRGNYSAFERMRAERLAQQQAQFSKQQQRVAEIESFVRRFRAQATKAKQAQSRLKELERMELIAPAHVDSPFSFTIPESDKISDPLLVLREADLGYDPNRPILRKVSINLHPGSRYGLLGPNGAGKSTLIKALAQDSTLLSGRLTRGEHLAIGYFAQHQLDALDLEATPLLHLQRLSPRESEQSLRNYLGSFGFYGDEALSVVKRFSGGEKARLALAIIAWQKPNLLLLDEPTNHLDLEMRQALTMALQGFSGAVLVVSHDRHLLKNTVDEFLLVADGQVTPFDGDLGDYEHWMTEQRRQQQVQTASDSDKLRQGESAEDRKNRKRLAAEARQQLSPLKKKHRELETQLDKLQTQLSVLETQLAEPELYEVSQKAKLTQLLAEQTSAKQKLAQVEEDWLLLGEEIEALEKDLLAE